ncbi:hypothetical protein [Rhizobium sullae]|uniref:hypothetical protein n=1 Tax=Rhizobium sullae TaxID=50338 RepID=UPI000B362B1F|nr:hypothetical protein [Rhizobium sullae]
MRPRKELLALVCALAIAALAGTFFFYVQDYASTESTRIEDPYKRTEGAPPDAVEDETGAPALKESKNAEQQQQ